MCNWIFNLQFHFFGALFIVHNQRPIGYTYILNFVKIHPAVLEILCMQAAFVVFFCLFFFLFFLSLKL